MATQDFGLSYTVEVPALWQVTLQGKNGASSTLFRHGIGLLNKHGAASTLFGDLISKNKHGGASSLFVDLVSKNKHGGASTFDAINLCSQRSILNGPLNAVLNGPGISTLSCG